MISQAGEDPSLEKIEQPSDAEINDVAKKLLKWNMLLSALEVHAELCERGRELHVLRDYFSNPGNFETHARYDSTIFGSIRRSASNLTLDSIDDFSRYSDDAGRETDEKVAVLEFELRRAKETIKELRENITEYAQENEASLANAQREIKETEDHEESTKPFELRALNYLANEHLLRNDYRLTAVTFGEEVNDQDLDDWDGVGVNTPRPPNLLHLFRDYGKHVMKPVQEDKAEIERLEQQIGQLEKRCMTLEAENEGLRKDKETLCNDLESAVDIAAALNKPPEPKISNFEQNDSFTSAQTGTDEQETTKNEKMTLPEIVINEDEQTESEDALDKIDVPDDKKIMNKVESLGAISNDGSASADEKIAANDFEADNISEDSFLDRYDCTDDQQDNQIITEAQVQQDDKNSIDFKYISSRQTTAAFLQALFGSVRGKTNSRLSDEIIKASDEEDAVQVIAKCLPNVVPNVLLNKREELIPIILCVVRLHPDVRIRDNLLHMLFNLIKRPDDEQRRTIIDGCVAFAKKVGPTRIEAEFLPQCWEQITHKYPERRLLVAETCGHMAPFIPAELLSSLTFSMLRQMLEDDRSEKVREAATKSFALILAFVDDNAKYTQAFDLLLKTLLDDSEPVSVASKQLLLPVIGVWALELDNLHSHLIKSIFERIHSNLKESSEAMANTDNGNEGQLLEGFDAQFSTLIGACTDLIPLLFAFVLKTAPFYQEETEDDEEGKIIHRLRDNRIPPSQNILNSLEIIFGDDRKLGTCVDKFDNYFRVPDPKSWEAVDWISENCLSQVGELAAFERCSQYTVMENLVCFLCTLCRTFGKSFTYKKITPYFEKLMRATELEYLNKDVPPICSPLLPLFIGGVLSAFMEEEDRKRLCTFLKQSLVTISTQNLPPVNLILSFVLLCANVKLHEDLIQVLRECLIHPSTVVRVSTAPLLEILVRRVENASLFSQVSSALITLSNDREFVVKIAAVPALGSIVETRTDKNLLERVCLQLQSLMDDPILAENIELQKTLLRTFAKIIPNSEPKFREDFLVHRLRKMAEVNSFTQDMRIQVDMARELAQTIAALLCCHIPCDLILSQILPSLRYLERDMKELAPDVSEIVTALIADCDNRISIENASEKSFAPTKEEMKNKLLSGFSRLKDASHLKRDIFKKKERSSTLH